MPHRSRMTRSSEWRNPFHNDFPHPSESCYNPASRWFPQSRTVLIDHLGRIVAMEDILKTIEAPANPNIPELRPGDSVSVHVKIKEGTRERIQEFKGTILYIHNDGV